MIGRHLAVIARGQRRAFVAERLQLPRAIFHPDRNESFLLAMRAFRTGWDRILLILRRKSHEKRGKDKQRQKENHKAFRHGARSGMPGKENSPCPIRFITVIQMEYNIANTESQIPMRFFPKNGAAVRKGMHAATKKRVIRIGVRSKSIHFLCFWRFFLENILIRCYII